MWCHRQCLKLADAVEKALASRSSELPLDALTRAAAKTEGKPQGCRAHYANLELRKT
jgi:hypothetical protein